MKRLYESLAAPLRKLPTFMDVEWRFARHTQSPCPQSLDDALAVKLWHNRLNDSLADLAHILYKCYGRPCIVLLDEFDVPFMEAERKCPCPPDKKEAVFGQPTCECDKSGDLLSSMLKMALKVFAFSYRAISTHFLLRATRLLVVSSSLG